MEVNRGVYREISCLFTEQKDGDVGVGPRGPVSLPHTSSQTPQTTLATPGSVTCCAGGVGRTRVFRPAFPDRSRPTCGKS